MDIYSDFFFNEEGQRLERLSEKFREKVAISVESEIFVHFTLCQKTLFRNFLALIFLNKLGMFSSSNGRVPQRRA